MTEKQRVQLGRSVAAAMGGVTMLYGLRHGSDAVAAIGLFWLIFFALNLLAER